MKAEELIEFYTKQNKPVQLNLGCFDKPFPNYINIDIREDTKCDLVDNIVTLDTIPDNSCNLIEAHHTFEHLSYKDGIEALLTWYKKLKNGGIIRLSVPDFDMAVRLYLWEQDINLIRSMICGSQRHSADFHLAIYNERLLAGLLDSCGFTDIRRWDWQGTAPHNYVDTYASSYHPDMAKEWLMANGKWLDMGGKLLSLNLQATKINRGPTNVS